MNLDFGSVCSGIEAASVAWGPLGWRAAWLSEIDPFACAVLAKRIPHAPNLGDMTTLSERIRAREVKAPDVFTGGTPCQAFSVAGRREGLADARGNLTMTFVEIADAIDDVRAADGDNECVVVWENVPGVLSSRDNAFGCFLGALAGSGCELQPAGGGRWSDAGCVYGPKRAIAWRTIDAQFFGLAQRRRRVFVVASSRNGFDPARVLFEFDGVRRDTPPRRETEQSLAGTIAGGARKRSGYSTDDISLTGCWWDGGQVAQTLDAVLSKGQTMPEKNRFPAVLQPVAFSCKDHGGDAGDVAPTLRAMGHGTSHANAGGQVAVAFHPLQDPISSTDGTTHALGCGSTSGQASIAIAFQSRGKDRVDVSVDCDYALLAGGGSGGRRHEMNIATPVTSVTGHVAHALNTANNGKGCGEDGTGRGVPLIAQAMAVRRLTPRECERLQGFEDDWTLIPVTVRKKITTERFAYLRETYPELTATDALLLARDGPRYKVIGNSWAVPCARWVGERIDAHLCELETRT